MWFKKKPKSPGLEFSESNFPKGSFYEHNKRYNLVIGWRNLVAHVFCFSDLESYYFPEEYKDKSYYPVEVTSH